MKTIRLLSLTALLLAPLAALHAADPVAAVFQRMKHGICVGHFERDQDQTAVADLDADYLDSIRSAGFNGIRFFFNTQRQPEFFATNVSHALKQGLIVNLCMFSFTKQKQQYVDRWREIATFYKDYPQELVFEMFNEPSLAHPGIVGVFRCQLIGTHGNDRWFEGKAKRTYLRDDGTPFPIMAAKVSEANRVSLKAAYDKAAAR